MQTVQGLLLNPTSSDIPQQIFYDRNGHVIIYFQILFSYKHTLSYTTQSFLTLPPLVVKVNNSIDMGNILEAFLLQFSNFVGVTPLVCPEQNDIQYHFKSQMRSVTELYIILLDLLRCQDVILCITDQVS